MKGVARFFAIVEHAEKRTEERTPGGLEFKVQEGKRKERERNSQLPEKEGKNSVSLAPRARTCRE